MFGPGHGETSTYEAEVVKITDAIAYINHDIGDANRPACLPKKTCRKKRCRMLGNSAHPGASNTMISAHHRLPPGRLPGW
jgi:dGTP triphosphohydrolase